MLLKCWIALISAVVVRVLTNLIQKSRPEFVAKLVGLPKLAETILTASSGPNYVLHHTELKR